MPPPESYRPPPKWGDDALSGFLEAATRNRWATFVKKSAEFALLSKLDSCWETIAKDWTNPRPLVSAHLLLRSHAAFRAACEHAAAGQVAEVFPMVRVAIEYAAYSLHISRNPNLETIWLQRHDDEASLKAAKSAFLVSEVRKSIEATNKKAAEVFDAIYQTSIDMGGHPNERSVTSNLDIIELADKKELRQIYLHGDGLQLDHALKTVARAGVCALLILQEAFPARFELLGVRHLLLKFQQGL